MGCDIHAMAEWFDAKTGEWRWARPPILPCDYCDATGKRRWDKAGCYFCKGTGKRRPNFAEHRDYDAFAILADVRNGRGFAGCDTGDGFTPIANPKGTNPPGASAQYRALVKHWGLDGHSHSWLTLAELLAYPWDSATRHRGYVDAHTYAAWVAKGRKGPPPSWCGDVSGGGIKKVSNARLDNLISTGAVKVMPLPPDALPPMSDHYTQVEWVETCREAASTLWRPVNGTIPMLQALAASKGLAPEHVRLVFFFDN